MLKERAGGCTHLAMMSEHMSGHAAYYRTLEHAVVLMRRIRRGCGCAGDTERNSSCRRQKSLCHLSHVRSSSSKFARPKKRLACHQDILGPKNVKPMQRSGTDGEVGNSAMPISRNAQCGGVSCLSDTPPAPVSVLPPPETATAPARHNCARSCIVRWPDVAAQRAS